MLEQLRNLKAVRDAAKDCLEQRGYAVTRDSTKRPNVFRLAKDGSSELCVMRVTRAPDGRISFERASDGSYTILGECDLVLYVKAPEGTTKISVMMFPARVVENYFEKLFQLKSDRGEKPGIPLWVAPNLERGWRKVLPGFEDEALWSSDWRMTADDD